ncbi:hypothetical protein ARSEF1564_008172 [Beauveria bassiana]
MLGRIRSKSSLQGHKLLMLGPWRVPPSPAQVAHIQARFPELAIEVCEKLSTSSHNSEDAQKRLWKDVTILVTNGELPAATQAPLLQYVQLWTAGTERIVNEPIFQHTEITFCTASGVHGCQVSEWVIATLLAWQHNSTFKVCSSLVLRPEG